MIRAPAVVTERPLQAVLFLAVAATSPYFWFGGQPVAAAVIPVLCTAVLVEASMSVGWKRRYYEELDGGGGPGDGGEDP